MTIFFDVIYPLNRLVKNIPGLFSVIIKKNRQEEVFHRRDKFSWAMLYSAYICPGLYNLKYYENCQTKTSQSS